MTFIDRVPPEIRPTLPWIGGFLVIFVLWVVVQEAKERDAPRTAIMSPAAFAAARAAQAWSADSAVACSDSALLVQRRVHSEVSRQLLADMSEPAQSVGDSAYLAWQHRRAALAAGTPAGQIYAGMDLCSDFGKR